MAKEESSGAFCRVIMLDEVISFDKIAALVASIEIRAEIGRTLDVFGSKGGLFLLRSSIFLLEDIAMSISGVRTTSSQGGGGDTVLPISKYCQPRETWPPLSGKICGRLILKMDHKRERERTLIKNRRLGNAWQGMHSPGWANIWWD